MSALPDPLRRAILRQHPEEAWRLHGRKPSVLARAACVPVPAAPEPLPVRRLALAIYLPGLRLASWNRMIGSKKQQHQAAAKRMSQAAMARVPRERLHRIPGAVSARITQGVPETDKRRWDVTNLCGKYLVDAIVSAGVLEDDHRLIVRSAPVDWAYADETCVRVVIVPERRPVPRLACNP